MPEAHALREVLGKFVTGVTVITAAGPDGPVGITANSFTSVSLDPALVLFCVHEASRVRATFGASSSFAVNILAAHQESVSRRFAGPADLRTEGVEFRRGSSGVPLLTDALAYLDCDLHQQISAGDHVIVIGRVRDVEVQCSGMRPLTFYGGRYASLSVPDSVSTS